MSKMTELPRKVLSARDNWQKGARLDGDAMETRTRRRLEKVARKRGFLPYDCKAVFKEIYDDGVSGARKSLVQCYRSQCSQGVRPDAAYYNPVTNKWRIFEIKYQKAGGNAHERSYKWLGLLPRIKAFLEIDYNPLYIIYGGDMAVHEKYITEFENILDFWPEWRNNWALERELTYERIASWF